MKSFYKNYLFLFLLLAAFGGSCDDDSTTPQQNVIEFSYQNLKPLDQNSEGVYEAWLSVETSFDHDDAAYRSLGRFNISGSGSIVDTSGNPFTLKLNRISNINATEDALITIEPPGDNDTLPGNIKMLGAAKSLQGSALVFNMVMSYHEILNGVAAQFPNAAAKYLLSAPSTGDTAQFNKGVWFAQNTNGTSPGLTLSTVPDTMDWTYQAWVIDTRDSINRIYNIGRFDASNERDDNHQCEQNPPVQIWNVPGHDWILANCPAGIPQITDLNNGFYKLMITLEPRFEQGTALQKPFFIRLFYGNLGPGIYGEILDLANVSAAYLPSAVIRLSTN